MTLFIYALLLLTFFSGGCAEVTRPTPSAGEVEECQLAATRRHPYKTWPLERVSRVFLKLLPTVPQVHGHTYPFLGFDWWVTDTGRIVVDNVWRPSPAARAGLKQGDLVLAVDNWPLPEWAPGWDKKMRDTRDVMRGLFLGVPVYLSKHEKTYPALLALPGELLVAVMLDGKHIALESRGTYLTGPVHLQLQRGSEKLFPPMTLYPQHLPANYAICIDTHDQTINAYAKPGMISLTRRLANLCRTDDELALVIGHELGHQVLGHLVRGAGEKQLAGAAGKVWQVVLAFATYPLNRLLNWRSFLLIDEKQPSVAQGWVVSAFSREDEREADAYGLWYAYQAGYDVVAALAVYERLAAVQHDPFEQTFFLASHPRPLERLARLKRIARYFQAGRAAEVFLQQADLDRQPPP